jgi:hypothetical protein
MKKSDKILVQSLSYLNNLIYFLLKIQLNLFDILSVQVMDVFDFNFGLIFALLALRLLFLYQVFVQKYYLSILLVYLNIKSKKH